MTCIICSATMRPHLDGVFDDRFGHPGSFDIVRCDGCGFMSTDPRLCDADLPELYSRYYPRSGMTPADVRAGTTPDAGTRRGRFRMWLKGLWTAHYEVSKGMRVLDYGCGSCISLLELQAAGADPYGIEVDANVHTLATALGVRVHVGALETFAEPDGSFDAVTLSQVIEHHPNPEAILRGLHAKLRQGGLLALTTPNSRALTRKLCERRWLHWHIPYHINHFHSGSLRMLMERTGFSVEKVRTFTPVPWWEYQLESLLEGPAVRGRPSAYFASGRSRIHSTRIGRVLIRLARAVAIVATHLLNPLGMGESLLIVARKH